MLLYRSSSYSLSISTSANFSKAHKIEASDESSEFDKTTRNHGLWT